MASALAILGGSPVIPGGLRATWPVFDDGDRQALLKVFDSGRWNSTAEVQRFAAEFARFHNARYGFALSNGTAGLEMALRAGGIEQGDEVLVPAVTFIATALAVIFVNAVPVIVDVAPETYCMDPEAAEAAITPRTRAILTVHYGGYPSDMDRLTEIARRHGLLLIEDCAHAHASEWRGRRVGGIGDAGAFSFQMSKTLTAGEGGMMITDCEEIAALRYLHPRSAPMTGLQAALLRAQLKRLPGQTEVRHETGAYLAGGLEEIGGVRPLRRDPRITKRGYYYFIIRYDAGHFQGVSRSLFIQALRAEGVPAEAGYGSPIHRHPSLLERRFGEGGYPRNFCPYLGRVDYAQVSCPVSERALAEEQVTLDGRLLLGGRTAAADILEAIRKVKRHADDLKMAGDRR